MEPNDAASSSARAQQLRASLSARREIEALLAEASATREAAVADADALIEEAQQVSEQLVLESRGEADRVTAEARQRAEELVSRARAEAEEITRQARAAADEVRARAEAQVEEYRRRVRAEVTEQVTREVTEQSRRELAVVQERQQGMIGDIEASVRILGVSMESAVANIAEMLGALDSLRVHTTESLGEPAPPVEPVEAAADEPADEPPAEVKPPRPEPIDHLIRSTLPIETGPDTEAEADEADEDVEDDGTPDSIFTNPAPASSVPASAPVFDGGTDEDADRDEHGDVGGDTGGDGEAPRTATEAFLRSAHIDHGDPPLPPLDDTDVGARYARDAMRANARAKARRSTDPVPAELSSETDAGDDGDASGKPLGWLFRSS